MVKIGQLETFEAERAPERHGIIIKHVSPHAQDPDVKDSERRLQELMQKAALRSGRRSVSSRGRSRTGTISDAIGVQFFRSPRFCFGLMIQPAELITRM